MFYAVWLSAFILHEWAIRKDNEFLIYCFRSDTTLDLSVVTGVVFKEHPDLTKFQCAPRYQSEAKMFKDNVFK